MKENSSTHYKVSNELRNFHTGIILFSLKGKCLVTLMDNIKGFKYIEIEEIFINNLHKNESTLFTYLKFLILYIVYLHLATAKLFLVIKIHG